ncbi:unnamed protein product [Diatraea saccharalis]|uniref:Juvenile hormone binding protein n=1 Tax=Diatraea saccharalis TaxID=40085 RepID=A0A9N9R173_9NEOP|nr:unnamed protein product [Diatraea saccharalis]
MGVLVKLLVIFLCIKCVFSNEALLDPCNHDDIECLNKAMESFFSKTSAGMPEYGIKQLEPVELKHVEYADPDSDIVMHFKNIKVKGMKNQQISDFKMDIDAKSVVLQTRIEADIAADLTIEFKDVAKFLSGTYKGKASDGDFVSFRFCKLKYCKTVILTSGKQTSSSLTQRASKILRLDEPSFENEFQRLILESDQCDSDRDVYNCLFYVAYIEASHSSESEVEESGSSTTFDDDVRRSDTTLATTMYSYDLKPNKEGVEYYEVGPDTISCEITGTPEVSIDSQFADIIAKDPDAVARKADYEKRATEVRKRAMCTIIAEAYKIVISNLRAAARILPKTAFFKDLL